jgi:hypothetical protein
MAAHKINYYFDASDSLRSMMRTVRGISELQHLLEQHVPPALAHAIHVKQLRGGTLHIATDNGAVAAKLKQLTPRLLNAYKKIGVEVTSIHYEVQVGESPAPVTSSLKFRHLSLETIGHLERVAADIEDGPLKQALLRLARRTPRP